MILPAIAPLYLWGITRCCCRKEEYLYAWGGSGSPGELRDNDRYAVEADSWTSKTDLPEPGRSLFAAAAVGGLGYSLGGETGPPESRSSRNDQYNPAGDSWSARADVPSPGRNQLAASAAANKVYCFAGVDLVPSGPSTYTTNDHADNDEYDPAADAWATKQDLPSPARRGPAATTIDDRVYSWTGVYAIPEDPYVQFLKDNDQYTPLADAWAAKTPAPDPARDAAGGASLDGKGYLICGRGPSDGRTDEYDPSSDSWTTKTDVLAAALWWPGVTSSSKHIHLVAGLTGTDNTWTQMNALYDPSTDAWSVGESLPLPARGQLPAQSL
jgi:hypothetical protein